jgi:murein L,D-transpeptidase YcbB/YkuD
MARETEVNLIVRGVETVFGGVPESHPLRDGLKRSRNGSMIYSWVNFAETQVPDIGARRFWCEGFDLEHLFSSFVKMPRLAVSGCLALILGLTGEPARAELATGSAFARSLATAVAETEGVAAFYKANGYRDLWTGPDDADRRQAALQAFSRAGDHGLPVARHDASALVAAFQSARTQRDRGQVEAAMTQAFLAYARDLSSGALTPSKVDAGIVREIARPDPQAMLQAIAASPTPHEFLRDLAPSSPEYARLLKEKLRLEGVIASGGWPNVPAAAQLQPGDQGPQVIALRDHLVARGYLTASAAATYDRSLLRAVQRFQLDHGLTADGVANAATLEALRLPASARLKSVIVALERLRWLGDAPRGARHIWVNLPEFMARIVDEGRTTFKTRAVIGKDVEDQRSPEFSDVMEYMVINPSWGVPRSIIVKEYLPLLQRNSNAVSHLQVVDNKGRVVPRGAVNFAAYSASSFPFGLRQPPSDGNALGKVKFMFPNVHNIYLHDTPAKNLFAHEVRAYSHGCIRLADPIDFAHILLSAQSEDPKGVFQTELESRLETSVSLDSSVPVHLVYFTAWPTARGQIGYRNDVYGRDGRLFDALSEAGVALTGEQG